MFSLFYIIYAIVFCGIAWAFQKLRNKLKKLPPGPYRFPLVGCLFQLIWADPKLHFVAFMKLSKYYKSDVIYVRLGVVNMVIIHGYDTCRVALAQWQWDGRLQEEWQLDRTLGKPYGLICSNGELWKETRLFTSKCLAEFGVGTRGKLDLHLQDGLRSLYSKIDRLIDTEGGEMSAKHRLTLPLTSAIWYTLFGYYLEHEKLLKLMGIIDQYFASGAFGAGLISAYPFLIHYAPKLVKFDQQVKLNSAVIAFLREEISNLQKSGQYRNEPNCFVEAFLKAIDETDNEHVHKDVYSEDNLISVLYDLLFAGHETTEHVLLFALLYLILYPAIQENVYQEILSVVGRNRAPVSEDKELMPYTSAMLLEVYRISSVIPLGPRKLSGDVTVEGYCIPKGTTALMNYYSVAMDEKMWPNPEEFRPERFLSPDGRTAINGHKIFPFSAGARSCIAASVARAAHFVTISGLVQKYDFKRSDLSNVDQPSLDRTCGFSVGPKHYTFKVEQRK